MKVYVITAYDMCGEDTEIVSVWDNKEDANKEIERIAPEYFGADIREYTVRTKGNVNEWWRDHFCY